LLPGRFLIISILLPNLIASTREKGALDAAPKGDCQNWRRVSPANEVFLPFSIQVIRRSRLLEDLGAEGEAPSETVTRRRSPSTRPITIFF